MEKSPAETPGPYDLYGPTTLLNLERSLADGNIPAAPELANVLEANSGKPLPAWFIAILVKSLRGELNRPRGRPKDSYLSDTRFEIAKWKYQLYLVWLQNVSVRPAWMGGRRFAEKIGGRVRRTSALPELLLSNGSNI
jgi:hypothetical protein